MKNDKHSQEIQIASFTFLRKLTRNQITTSYINIGNEKIMTGCFPGEGVTCYNEPPNWGIAIS